MLLQEGTWKSLNMSPILVKKGIIKPELEDDDTNELSLFQETGKKSSVKTWPPYVLNASSCFYLIPDTHTSSIPTVPVANPALADPTIQNDTQFKYTDASTSGFMKIVLGGIAYGFGSTLYPNVVAQVATYNSWMIYHHKQMKKLMPAANLPFSPKISNITANYDANTALNGKYPYKCYTYSALGSTPFVLGSNSKTNTNSLTYKQENNDLAVLTNDLLFSSSYSGFLFLEVENLVPTEAMNLYFELTNDQSLDALSERKVTYYYLNNDGWLPMQVVADDTADFSCSGLVSLMVPTEISLENFIGTGKKYWICIAADVNSGPFPSIVLLKPNGIRAQRFAGGVSTTELPTGSISKSQTFIPQIATITQPFPSCGGQAAEDELQMNQRVSLRLKTKDRAVNTEDYYRLIRETHNDIFYSKVVFDPGTKMRHIFVVPTIANWQDANAYKPLLNQCVLNNITAFLANRTSGITPIKVSNFNLAPIRVHANIKVGMGFTCEGVMKNVNQSLILFLSPWIAGNQPKIIIDQQISHAALTTFIKNIPGVEVVSDVFWDYTQNEMGKEEGRLIVSVTNHFLNCSY